MIIFTQNQPITFEHIDAVKELADKIKRVRALHKPVNIGSDGFPEWLICEGCSHKDLDGDQLVNYPCDTIKALDGEQ